MWIFIVSTALTGWTFANSFSGRSLGYDPIPYLAAKAPYPKSSLAIKDDSLKDCVPVHINHLGRHGSRHMGKPIDEEVVKIITLAEKNNQLKASAHRLPAMLTEALALEVPANLGQLTEQGRKEHRGIAERMYLSFPELFAKSEKPFLLSSTYKQRTTDSMNAFWEKLISLNPDLSQRERITTGNKEICDPLLRFHDGCISFENFKNTHPLKKEIEKTFASMAKPKIKDIIERIFKPDFVDSLDEKIKLKLVRDFYRLCQLQASLDSQNISNGFCSLFVSPQEIKVFNWEEDIINFLVKGPNKEENLSSQIACPLLKDFIDTSALAIRDKNAPAANLRFAHAETVIPFLALLGLYQDDTFDDILNKPEKRNYKSSEISPMAANVQWILYHCPTDEYRVRMRHNERDVRFPIEGCGNTSCAFERIKDFYEKAGRVCDNKTWAESVCQGTSCQFRAP